MKVFGKQGSSFIVSMTKDELQTIAFGKTSPEYDREVKEKAVELVKRCETQETIVDVSPVFAKMMRLHCTDLRDSSRGLITLLNKLAEELKPVEKFINAIEAESKAH